MQRPRLLLADDHALVIAGLRKLLEPDFDVVGTAEDGRTLIQRAQELEPDAILLDISMPLLNGLEAARQIHKLVPGSKIVFLTMHADPDYVGEAFRAGASGYLLKRSAASELVTALRQVLSGGTYITPLVSITSVTRHPGKSLKPHEPAFELTGRQREVLQLVAEGKSTKVVAAMLHISIKTVEFHKAAIMHRLRLHSIAELTKYAIEHRITSI